MPSSNGRVAQPAAYNGLVPHNSNGMSAGSIDENDF
jgi:hypothetical protein